MILVVIKIGNMQQQSGLLADDFRQPRMRVAERVDADSGDQIQIALARRVVHIAAFAAMDDQREARVVLQQVLFFQVDYRGVLA